MTQQLLNITATASVNTRRFVDSVIVPPVAAQSTYGQVLQSTFNVDPNNPFFYIFACGAAANNISFGEGLPIGSKFEFLQGGVTQTSETLWWGNPKGLDDASVVPFNMSVNLVLNQPALQAHDTVSQSCPYPTPTDAIAGMITRWSAKCDSIRVTSTIYKAQGFVGNWPTFTLMHGVQQQPW